MDEAGNVVGKWSIASTSALVLGSHIDTVPEGGAFDGAFGVLGALEAVRMLKARSSKGG